MFADKMNGRERWLSALWGKPVDRIPVWMGIPGKKSANIKYTDDFLPGWMADENYRKMLLDFSCISDEINQIDIYPFNRFLLTPEKYIERKEWVRMDNNIREQNIIINTPHGELYDTDQRLRGIGTVWTTKYPVQNIEDLRKLAGIPFDIDYDEIDRLYVNYKKRLVDIGNEGILKIFLSSPIVVISGCMSFETFLELAYVEKDYFLELLDMITERYLEALEAIFSKHDYDAIFWMGGSEQCTPPMMNPHSFDEFVVPYDKKIVQFFRDHGKFIGCHCHGKIRYALSRMIDIGYQATDPVEPPPQGDLNIDEAVKIADGKIALLGNFEFEELENKNAEYITQRTLEILKHSDKRIIIAASASSLSIASENLVNNYYAILNAYKNFYGIEPR